MEQEKEFDQEAFDKFTLEFIKLLNKYSDEYYLGWDLIDATIKCISHIYFSITMKDQDKNKVYIDLESRISRIMMDTKEKFLKNKES